MATIKTYTTIEQSKVLAKILPLESADMYYSWIGTTYLIHAESYNEIIRWRKEYAKKHNHPSVQRSIIPCWSLAALIKYLSEINPQTYTPILFPSEGKWILQFTEYGHGNVYEVSCDNPVDAYYELILKLHKRKML